MRGRGVDLVKEGGGYIVASRCQGKIPTGGILCAYHNTGEGKKMRWRKGFLRKRQTRTSGKRETRDSQVPKRIEWSG